MINLETRIINFLRSKDHKDIKIVRTLEILHHEWELDSYIFLVSTSSGARVIGTQHGSPYFMSKQEIQNKISEYQHLANAYSNLLMHEFDESSSGE